MKFIKKKWIGIFLCFGIIFHFAFKFLNKKILAVKTEPAECSLIQDRIETEGFLVWDENVLNLEKPNGIVYKIDDGWRVAKGEALAEIYENLETVDLSSQIKNLDQEIKNINELIRAEKIDLRKPDVLDFEINKLIEEAQISFIKNNYSEIFEKRGKIQKLISEKKLSIDKDEKFEDRLVYLKSEKKRLEGQLLKPQKVIYSEQAGYFISFLDGYEYAANYSDIKKHMISSFNIENLAPRKIENSIGRIVGSGDWYMLCNISDEDKQKIKKDMACEVCIPIIDEQKIACTVYDVIHENNGMTTLVLCGRDINKNIFNFRKGRVHIKLNEYYGYKLKKSSICYKDLAENDEKLNNLIGVNVKSGNDIVFKRINLIYSGEDFVVAAEKPIEESEKSHYLRRGDEVVV